MVGPGGMCMYDWVTLWYSKGVKHGLGDHRSTFLQVLLIPRMFAFIYI